MVICLRELGWVVVFRVCLRGYVLERVRLGLKWKILRYNNLGRWYRGFVKGRGSG